MALRSSSGEAAINSGSTSDSSYLGRRLIMFLVAMISPVPRVYCCSYACLRERPLGQNVNCTDEVMCDCLVGAITENVHASYCTAAETLTEDPTHTSARTLASASVPPLGMNSWLTL